MSYRGIDKLNQSLLKKMLISPKEFLIAKAKYEETEDSEEDHFVFGTALDIMLTGTKEEFENKFLKVPDSLKCTDTVKVIIENVFNTLLESASSIGVLGDYRPKILFQCKLQNYYGNWKDDTRIDSVIKSGSDYFDLLIKGKDKTLITNTEYSNAVTCMMALKSDPFTSIYCNKKMVPKTIEFIDKFIVEFEYEGVEIKGELDRIIIDHDKKAIIPTDFKSTGKDIIKGKTAFKNDFWLYRYDIQAATYTLGLSKHPFIMDLIEKGYVLESFRYIVVEKHLKNNPMIFKITSETLLIGLVGGELSNGRVMEGLSQAISRYKFATQNKAWDYPMEYYQNNGFILLEP